MIACVWMLVTDIDRTFILSRCDCTSSAPHMHESKHTVKLWVCVNLFWIAGNCSGDVLAAIPLAAWLAGSSAGKSIMRWLRWCRLPSIIHESTLLHTTVLRNTARHWNTDRRCPQRCSSRYSAARVDVAGSRRFSFHKHHGNLGGRRPTFFWVVNERVEFFTPSKVRMESLQAITIC